MKRIITIQHTQSEQHINKMIGSWTSWDLTETGIQQAHAIGENLAYELGNNPCLLFSSDLLRAKHTSEIIAKHLHTEPIFTEALREFYFGEAIGHSKAWATEHLQCAVWPGTIDWPVNIHDAPFVNAETKLNVWNRLSPFLEQILSLPEENIILISHDGTFSLFFAMWLELDVSILNKIHLSGKTGGVSFLQEDDMKHRTILKLNDMSYLHTQ